MTESQQPDDVKINSTNYEELAKGGSAKSSPDNLDVNTEHAYNKFVNNVNYGMRATVTDGSAYDLEQVDPN